MQNKKTIVCFTASFPYGRRETYFENELNYLCNNFDHVLIVPAYNPYGDYKREIPKNASLCEVILPQGKKRIISGLCNLRIHFPLLKEFFVKKVFFNKTRLEKWGNGYLSYCIGLNYCRQLNIDPDTTILYSYWAGMSFFPNKRFNKIRKVIRMHGGDFYVERNGGYLPLRKEIYNCADLLLPISKDIAKLLISKYKVNESKINLSYLGVENDSDRCVVDFSRKVLKVISCSNVYPLKRVELIFETLNSLSIDVEWTHIGGGESFTDLEEFISLNKSDKLKVHLTGVLNQEQIKKIYRENYFDFFINTSRFEGLPVSIMEAFSYGIPAVATNVGGTSEIVNERNGLIVASDFRVTELAETLEKLVRSGSFVQKRKYALEMWVERFDADKNYSRLVQDLNKL